MCPDHLGENAEDCDQCRTDSHRRRAAIVATRKLLDAIHAERADVDRREAAALDRLTKLEKDNHQAKNPF